MAKSFIPDGKGTVEVNLPLCGKRKISDVIHVPGMHTNLLSVSQLTDKGMVVIFAGDQCTMYREAEYDIKGDPVVTASKTNGMY